MYYDNNDRRLFPRFNIACFAGIKIASSDIGICALCHDISVNGIGLMVDTQLASKQTLEIMLQFPDTTTINSLGRVVWSEKKGNGKYWAGLEFTHIDVTKLKKWITTQA